MALDDETNAGDPHRDLMGLARRFQEAAQRNDRALALTILLELQSQVAAHMEHEESSMHRVAYPFVRTHMAAHARFLRRFRALEREYGRARLPSGTALEIADILLGYVREHVRLMDAAFDAFVASRDRAAARALEPAPAPPAGAPRLPRRFTG